MLNNMENTLSYSYTAYTIVANVLTLGYAAMAVGLVYFLATSSRSAPRYRISSTLSAVVMASAFLALWGLSQNWQRAFEWTGEAFVLVSNDAFTNGYRYINWSIDVPILLTQLLIVLGYSGADMRRKWTQFIVAGLLMVYTGYVGQFYEVELSSPFYIWGTLSTVFFLWLLVVVRNTITERPERLNEKAQGMLGKVWWLIVFSWLLYPGAYLMPVFAFSEGGVVARQITYTVADITSKVIYGVMLSRIAYLRSRDEGYLLPDEERIGQEGQVRAAAAKGKRSR